MIRQRYLRLAGLAVCSLLFSSSLQAQFGSTQYRVTVTNLTRGQILSPAIVATHADHDSILFKLGEPASEALWMVAEDAENGAMMDMLSAMPDVLDVKVAMGAAGPIMPGESASVDVDMRFSNRYVSVVSMLVTTNDSFMAIQNVRGPNLGSAEHYSPAYDAGSEMNTESCADIPGPPCGNKGFRVTDGAEGYVYISSGFTGNDAMLPPGAHDWRNPVAKIVIERINPGQ